MDGGAREAARRERGDIPDSGAHALRREVFPAGAAWVCAVCWDEYGTVRQEWPCRSVLLARVAALTARYADLRDAAQGFHDYIVAQPCTLGSAAFDAFAAALAGARDERRTDGAQGTEGCDAIRE